MKGKIAWSCGAMLLLAGCAGYTPTAAPVVQATDSDLVFNAEGYGAKVDPYLDEQRQKQYFNANFTDAGYLAVDVVVKNEGKHPVDVKPEYIYLVFQGGDQMAPIESRVVANQIEEGGSVVASTIMFGAVGALITAQAQQDAKTSRIMDYAAKQLKETTLVPGATTQGYLFYRWTPSASAQAEFIVQLQDHSDNHLSRLTLPFGETKPFAVPQSAAFVPSAPPANPPAAPSVVYGGTPSTNGPVDVPFKIQDGYETIDGVGILDSGHLSGQASSKGKQITLVGDRKGDGYSIDLSGAILSTHASTFVANPYCEARGTTGSTSGKITIPMSAICEGGNKQITVSLDLPPAAAQFTTAAAAPSVPVANGPVNLAFKIEDESEMIEGTGTLNNGYLAGQALRNGQPITVTGNKQGDDFAIELAGPLLSGTAAPYSNPYCTASGVAPFTAGQAAVPVQATCESGTRKMTVYLDLPPAS
jgi:hypothetical protein